MNAFRKLIDFSNPCLHVEAVSMSVGRWRGVQALSSVVVYIYINICIYNIIYILIIK